MSDEPAEAVRAAVNRCDPERLLRRGAPDDEYKGEVREIVARLGEIASASDGERVARTVFERRFSTPSHARVYSAGAFDALGEELATIARASWNTPTIDR